MQTMQGKTVLVTGGSDGIGRAAALGLAKLGAAVSIVGRTPGKTEDAARDIRAQSGNDAVSAHVLDMSSQQAVRNFAARFLSETPRLDVLINNAGGLQSTRRETPEGLELTLATNYLGPFLLTNLLLDRLRASAPARVITVSSLAERIGTLRFDDLQSREHYSGFAAYAQSKRADLMFALALARRLAGPGAGVTSNAMHPGYVRSSFGTTQGGPSALLMQAIRPLGRTPAHAAETLVWLASDPQFDTVSGRFFTEHRRAGASRGAHDVAAQDRLWEMSEALTELRGVLVRS